MLFRLCSILSVRNNGCWLVWQRVGNGVGHINKVVLRRARLVLGLVTTFGSGHNIMVFIQAHSAWPSLRG